MLGFEYLDTGAMYRMAALVAIRSLTPPDDGTLIAGLLEKHSLSADSSGAFLDEEDVSALIRTPGMGDAASRLSALPPVRRAMVGKQREFAAGRDLVAEGRDMGTVVFPDALLKIYVIADIAVRGVRRMREVHGRQPGGMPSVFVEVLESLIRRDRRDRERLDSPLRPAPDAMILDTSLMSVSEQVERVVSLYGSAKAGRIDAR